MYIKPQVTVRHIDMPLLIAPSQEVQDGTINFAPENETNIESESDFI